MKIWLITVGEPLPLEGHTERLWRTGLLASELEERGHHVVWWTSTVNHFSKTYHRTQSSLVKRSDRLSIQFLHGRLYSRNISIQRLLNHREIAREFRRISSDHERPDVVLCSFPTIELSYEAVQYGRRTDVPVVLDVRDLWPDEIAARVPALARWLLPIVLRDLYLKTRLAFEGAWGVVGISRSYLEWGLGHASRRQRKADAVVHHGYPDPLGAAGDAPPAKDLLLPSGVDPAKRVYWFVGTFVGSIDLGTVIEAARLLRHRSDIQFVLTGSGERAAEWQKQAQGLENVVFTGWADRQQLSSLAAVAYIGLAAYKRRALMSLTNKIFEYLGFGIPVLCSLPGEARSLLEDSGAGGYYTPEDARALASTVESLAGDPERRDQMALAARNLFEREFSAKQIYSRFADHLESCHTTFVENSA